MESGGEGGRMEGEGMKRAGEGREQPTFRGWGGRWCFDRICSVDGVVWEMVV